MYDELQLFDYKFKNWMKLKFLEDIIIDEKLKILHVLFLINYNLYLID